MEDLENAGLDDEVVKTIEEKKVYFNTSDITSTDKLIGVEAETLVKFKLYKDEKGIGAEAVTDAEGNAICGQVRPAPKKKFKRKTKGKKKFQKGKKGKGRQNGPRRSQRKNKGKRVQKRRNSWSEGQKQKKNKRQKRGRKTVGWGELNNVQSIKTLVDAPRGKSRGFVVWWDKSAGEGCIATEQNQRYKCTMDQVQCEKPCWAFLEKDQIIEFQAGQDRFGHGVCFYVTGPGGTLIRQNTTLDQANGMSEKPASAVPPTAAGGGRFLSTNDGWGKSKGGGWARKRNKGRW